MADSTLWYLGVGSAQSASFGGDVHCHRRSVKDLMFGGGNMRSIPAVLGFALVASGCVQDRTNIATPFDPAEHAYASFHGLAVVYGQVAFRSATGAVVTNPGKPVYLMPKTKYTMEMAAKFRGDFANRVDIQNIDGRLGSYVRMAVVAPGGTFVFGAVPPGSYLAVTNIEEMIPAALAGYNGRERSLVGDVMVPASGSVSIVLDR